MWAGLLDEAVILAAFVYWVGPQDVLYSLKHAYVTWVQPKLEPILRDTFGTHATAAMPKAKDD